MTQVHFLEHRDGVLEYGLHLRRDIAEAIRRFRPDAVLTMSWQVETPVGLNQADAPVTSLLCDGDVVTDVRIEVIR